jgi:hypothetical protein
MIWYLAGEGMNELNVRTGLREEVYLPSAAREQNMRNTRSFNRIEQHSNTITYNFNNSTASTSDSNTWRI